MAEDKPKIIRISEMDSEFSDYDEDTIFVLDEPPLRDPLGQLKPKPDSKSK